MFVVNDKNEAMERTVQVGLLQGHLRAITDGLEPNDRVIINGMQRVRHQMVVDPQPDTMTADEPISADTSVAPNATVTPTEAAPAKAAPAKAPATPKAASPPAASPPASPAAAK